MSVSYNVVKAADPIYTHNYSEFMNTQNNISSLSFSKFSFQEKNGTINFVVKNILNDYMYELNKLAQVFELSDKEIEKYSYKPKLMCADIYGTTELYYLILKLNNMRGPNEFTNISRIKLIPKTTLYSALAYIYNAESTNINIYNSLHT